MNKHTPFLAFLLIIQATQTFDSANTDELLAQAKKAFPGRQVYLVAHGNLVCRYCTRTSPTEKGIKRHVQTEHQVYFTSTRNLETKLLYLIKVGKNGFWLPGCKKPQKTAPFAFQYSNTVATKKRKAEEREDEEPRTKRRRTGRSAAPYTVVSNNGDEERRQSERATNAPLDTFSNDDDDDDDDAALTAPRTSKGKPGINHTLNKYISDSDDDDFDVLAALKKIAESFDIP